MKSLIVPVANEHYVTIIANWPLTTQEWEHLLRILEVMKPGIVSDEQTSNGGQHTMSEKELPR
jgi:hypothetical protein